MNTRTLLSNGSISRNSRSARSASASSKGRRCRHCSDRHKSRAGQNSASRHRTRNIAGPDRYTSDAGSGAPCAQPQPSGRKLEGYYSVAVDSPAESRSRASVAPAVFEPGQPARQPAAVIGRLQSTETSGGTSAQHRRRAVVRRFKSRCEASATASGSVGETTAFRRDLLAAPGCDVQSRPRDRFASGDGRAPHEDAAQHAAEPSFCTLRRHQATRTVNSLPRSLSTASGWER